MKTLKRFALFAISVMLVFGIAGCSFSISTAKINDAIMTDSIDAEGKPGNEVTSYSADTSSVYTSAILNNAPDNTQIRIVWIYVTTGEIIDEVKFDSGTISDRYIYSSLAPAINLPAGDYEVDYYVDERTEPDATVSFKITEAEDKAAAAEAAASTEPYLEDVHMTSGFDDSGVPMDTIDTVEPTGTWYVSAILRNTQPDTTIDFVWYDTSGGIIDRYTFDPEGETDVYIGGSLEITTFAPEGDYWVELYLGDDTTPSAQVSFSVVNVDASTAASTADYTTYTMEEGGFTLRYPSNWQYLEVLESYTAAFYSDDYRIDDEGDINTVIVVALKDFAQGYTPDEILDSWIQSTDNAGYENYVNLGDSIDTIDGRDIASFVYSWSRDDYDLYTMDYLFMENDDVYVITFTATAGDIAELYPYVESIVLSFGLI